MGEIVFCYLKIPNKPISIPGNIEAKRLLSLHLILFITLAGSSPMAMISMGVIMGCELVTTAIEAKNCQFQIPGSVGLAA